MNTSSSTVFILSLSLFFSNLFMAGAGKQTRGRQKIEMKLIGDYEDRLVTFSKRRSGIYKKASELVTMCGVQLGLIVFSPTGKAFSFGSPSIESITNRFLNRHEDPAALDQYQPIFDAHRGRMRDRENEYFNALLARLDEAKERGKALRRITRATREGAPANWELGWWEKNIDELSPEQLKEQIASIEASHRDLCNYMNHPVDLAALRLADPASEPAALRDPARDGEAVAGPSWENAQH